MDRAQSKDGDSGASGAAERPESELVERARAGDRAALGLLLRRHADRVFGLAFRLVRGRRHDAEELAQEALLRAIRGIASFRGGCAFSTWLHRIVVNLHLNRESTLATRAERRAASLSAPLGGEDDGPRLEVGAAEPAPPERAAAAEELARLRTAFDALDDERRTAIVLRDVEGLSYEEIAATLAIPIGTVRSRLARAREELSRQLGGDGFVRS